MILGQEKKSIFGLKGQTPERLEDPTSKLHYQSSINNNPLLSSLKFLKFQKALVPSVLDPRSPIPKYMDSPPK